MEVTETTATVALVVVFAVVVGSTMTSPMPFGLRVGISAGAVVAGLLLFGLGVGYGQYRATGE